jgi:hypothetical protein
MSSALYRWSLCVILQSVGVVCQLGARAASMSATLAAALVASLRACVVVNLNVCMVSGSLVVIGGVYGLHFSGFNLAPADAAYIAKSLPQLVAHLAGGLRCFGGFGLRFVVL